MPRTQATTTSLSSRTKRSMTALGAPRRPFATAPDRDRIEVPRVAAPAIAKGWRACEWSHQSRATSEYALGSIASQAMARIPAHVWAAGMLSRAALRSRRATRARGRNEKRRNGEKVERNRISKSGLGEMGGRGPAFRKGPAHDWQEAVKPAEAGAARGRCTSAAVALARSSIRRCHPVDDCATDACGASPNSLSGTLKPPTVERDGLSP